MDVGCWFFGAEVYILCGEQNYKNVKERLVNKSAI